MSGNRGRRKGRVGYQALAEYERYVKALRLRTDGCSWCEIAAELGYKSRSGAEHAVVRGLDASMLIPGLRVVMRDRLNRFWPRLDCLEPWVAPGEVDDYLEALLGVVRGFPLSV